MSKLIVPPRYEKHQIQYYPDTNILGYADAYTFLLSVDACRLLDETIEETLAKRDQRVEALLARLVGQARIADDAYFGELGSVSTLKLVRKCACTLAPELYGAIRQLEDERPIPEARLEDALRAVDKAMRERLDKTDQNRIGELVADHNADNPSSPLGQEVVQEIRRQVRPAWYRYLSKRFKALLAGNYKWTDEYLCGAAVAEAFLRGNVSVIISSDKDFHVVMKQCTDNLLKWYARIKSLRETGTEDNELTYLQQEVEITEKLRREVLHKKMDGELVLDLTGLSAIETRVLERFLLVGVATYLQGTVVVLDWWNSRSSVFYYPSHIIEFAKKIVFREQTITDPG